MVFCLMTRRLISLRRPALAQMLGLWTGNSFAIFDHVLLELDGSPFRLMLAATCRLTSQATPQYLSRLTFRNYHVS